MKFHVMILAGAMLIAQGASAAEEVVMSRRTLDRSNLFRSGNFSFSVSTDENSPSGWLGKAVKGNMERNVPIDRSGVTLIFFPGEILEVRNNRLPGRENWNMMQETIGEFEIIRRAPADFFKTLPVETAQEKKDGHAVCVFRNGTFALRMLPAFNGAIYSLTDSVSGMEFFYGNPAGARGKNAFEKLGFLEMVNQLGRTAAVEFDPTQEKLPGGGAILNMEREIPNSGGVRISRSVELAPGLPLVRIHSFFSTSGQVKNAFCIKHRPEATYVGGADNRAVSIFTEDNGVWKEKMSPSGEVIPRGTRYAMADRCRGILFGVSYEAQDLQQLYLWNAENYVTLEAWSKKRTLEKPLGLKVRYFLIRGMSKVNFLGTDGAIFIRDIHPVVHAGKDWDVSLVYGSASLWKNPEIAIRIENSRGETVLSAKHALPSPVPGFAASPVRLTLDTGKFLPGAYQVHFSLSEGDIAGCIPLAVISADQLQEFRKTLCRIDERLAEQRKNYRDLPSAKKKQALREFKRLLNIRNQFEEALKKGDMKELQKLARELE